MRVQKRQVEIFFLFQFQPVVANVGEYCFHVNAFTKATLKIFFSTLSLWQRQKSTTVEKKRIS